jgi:CHAD domain-containing protein
MQGQLIKYCDKCFLSITSNLYALGADCDRESVHKLRLSIKKLHVLLKLLDFWSNSRKKSKLLKRIDTMFLYAGNLRDIQIQIDLLKLYGNRIEEDVDRLIASLNKEQKKIEKKLKSKIISINPFDIVLLNQQIDNTIEMISDKALTEILHAKVEELMLLIKQNLNDNLDENILHKIRMQIKELIYSLSVMKKGSPVFKHSESFIKNLDKLQDKLGCWHDLKILLDWLNKFNLTDEGNSRVKLAIGADKMIFYDSLVNDLNKFNDEELLIKKGE